MSDAQRIPLTYSFPPAQPPTALKIVAWLFIVIGVLTIIQMIVLLTQRQIDFSLGLLGVFIGPGLLRYSRGWRSCALVLIWFGMIVTPVIIALSLLSSRLMDVDLFGVRVGSAPPAIGSLLGVLFFGLAVWEYRVLVREDVRKRFGLPPRYHP